MVRFFELLQLAKEKDVSSEVTTSVKKELGCIDKLEIYFQVPIKRSEVEEVTSGISKITRLRDKRWYLEIGKDTGTYLYLGHPDNTDLVKLITKPSTFHNVNQYKSYLYKYFGVDRIENARISRMDLTVDYLEPWSKVVRGLSIEHKRKRVQYLEHSGQRTGIQAGSGSQVIVVYDKRAESKLDHDITRIELQLKGKELPIRTFKDLSQLPDRLKNSNLFSGIILNEISITELRGDNPLRLKRLGELTALLEHEGYFIARKKLNSSNNFNRDYAPLLNIRMWDRQPQEVIEKFVYDYFKEEYLWN